MATARKSSSAAKPVAKQDDSQKKIEALEGKVLLLESQLAELKSLLSAAQEKTAKELSALSAKCDKASSGGSDNSGLAAQVEANRKNLRSLGYR